MEMFGEITKTAGLKRYSADMYNQRKTKKVHCYNKIAMIKTR